MHLNSQPKLVRCIDRNSIQFPPSTTNWNRRREICLWRTQLRCSGVKSVSSYLADPAGHYQGLLYTPFHLPDLATCHTLLPTKLIYLPDGLTSHPLLSAQLLTCWTHWPAKVMHPMLYKFLYFTFSLFRLPQLLNFLTLIPINS